MSAYLAVIALIFALLLGGIGVDRLYRRFAAKNPLLGPFRDTSKCGSCSAGSGCGAASCASEGAGPGSAQPPR